LFAYDIEEYARHGGDAQTRVNVPSGNGGLEASARTNSPR